MEDFDIEIVPRKRGNRDNTKTKKVEKYSLIKNDTKTQKKDKKKIANLI
jgi:hypothetical protein